MSYSGPKRHKTDTEATQPAEKLSHLKDLRRQRRLVPSEDSEQRIVVGALRRGRSPAGGRILFTHVPLGGARGRNSGAAMRRLGARKGMPDLLIFEAVDDFVGVALEMKRIRGGVVSPEQRETLEELAARGWLCVVARGAEDALSTLRDAGFRL